MYQSVDLRRRPSLFVAHGTDQHALGPSVDSGPPAVAGLLAGNLPQVERHLDGCRGYGDVNFLETDQVSSSVSSLDN